MSSSITLISISSWCELITLGVPSILGWLSKNIRLPSLLEEISTYLFGWDLPWGWGCINWVELQKTYNETASQRVKWKTETKQMAEKQIKVLTWLPSSVRTQKLQPWNISEIAPTLWVSLHNWLKQPVKRTKEEPSVQFLWCNYLYLKISDALM